MDTNKSIEQDRTALYRREAAGEVVTAEEWLALGDRQIAVNEQLDAFGERHELAVIVTRSRAKIDRLAGR